MQSTPPRECPSVETINIVIRQYNSGIVEGVIHMLSIYLT